MKTSALSESESILDDELSTATFSSKRERVRIGYYRGPHRSYFFVISLFANVDYCDRIEAEFYEVNFDMVKIAVVSLGCNKNLVDSEMSFSESQF